ncbi:hypothetical protein [Pedobacter antarcticus]|uniref:hypothetical protein n=1 Tax=Pedobacter antarcticus TaxID=34086 RepID=UPI000892243B|nr:hypothetical protein [Pedobacter antarcticus]SDL68460.1 hypothetical protein SAMN04488084_10297 [Pedobacter antarcticus]
MTNLKNTAALKVLIAGGYGHVGSNIARHLRKKHPEINLILGGRHPEKGHQFAAEIGRTECIFLDVNKPFDSDSAGSPDLIIAALQDHKNMLFDAAVENNISYISITRTADEVAPMIFKALQKQPLSKLVLTDHWQAGVLTIVAKQVAEQFQQINTIETACVYDELDPIGPMIAAQMDSFVTRALIRNEKNWIFVDATEYPRDFYLANGTAARGYPMGTLDVPSLASLTDASNVRFDIVIGQSIGTNQGKNASHDLYIDIEGILVSGKPAKMRTIVSDPAGQSHLTALGVLISVEGIFGLSGQLPPSNGGIYLPETLLNATNAVKTLKEFGVTITQTEI